MSNVFSRCRSRWLIADCVTCSSCAAAPTVPRRTTASRARRVLYEGMPTLCDLISAWTVDSQYYEFNSRYMQLNISFHEINLRRDCDLASVRPDVPINCEAQHAKGTNNDRSIDRRCRGNGPRCRLGKRPKPPLDRQARWHGFRS